MIDISYRFERGSDDTDKAASPFRATELLCGSGSKRGSFGPTDPSSHTVGGAACAASNIASSHTTSGPSRLIVEAASAVGGNTAGILAQELEVRSDW